MTRETPKQALWLLVFLQALVSAASLVVEIVAGRMLAPYVGMSLYTWTSVIAVVLAGFSAGHWIGGRLAERDDASALRQTAWTMVAAAVTTGMAVFLLRWSAGPVSAAFSSPLAVIVALTTIAFFLPSLFAGVPAPVLARISVHDAAPGQQGRALGAMFAAGALGAIAGTLAAGFLFISWLGSILTLALMTGVYALVAVTLFVMASRAGKGGAFGPSVAGALAAVLIGSGMSAESPCSRESDYFCIRTVALSSDPAEPVNLMVLDHLVHGISGKNDPQAMYTGHAAMIDGIVRERLSSRIASGGRFSAYFIGGGTFSVPRAWAEAGIADVTVAEIDPVVTEVAERDFWFDLQKSTVLHTDARRGLADSDKRHDVIVGDAFTDIAIPPHLVTREFFDLIASRLEPGGFYIMNVVDHLDQLDAFASIVRTLRSVFPVVEVWAESSAGAEGKRTTFIVVAGEAATQTGQLALAGPEPFVALRIPEGRLNQIVETRRTVMLTDDYTPIDRLMGIRGDFD